MVCPIRNETVGPRQVSALGKPGLDDAIGELLESFLLSRGDGGDGKGNGSDQIDLTRAGYFSSIAKQMLGDDFVEILSKKTDLRGAQTPRRKEWVKPERLDPNADGGELPFLWTGWPGEEPV
jgi:hypothetical protein